jgi:hypothetical protein
VRQRAEKADADQSLQPAPPWLDLAHAKLDAAAVAAYGWPPTLSDDELLAKLLELNLSRAT